MGTNFSKGLSIYGVPMYPENNSAIATGKRYFVCSVNGVDEVTAYGTKPDAPFATIDYAINQCTTKGDIIYVMENHAETVNSTGDLNPDVAGIQIIGLGQTNTRPIIGMASTGIKPKANIRVTGKGTRFSNLIFRGSTLASYGTSTIALNIRAMDVQVDNCRFDTATSAVDMAFPIYIGATASTTNLDRIKILNNEIINFGGTAQGTAAIALRSTGSTANNCMVIGNTISGCFAGAATVGGAIFGSSQSSFRNLIIHKNDIYNFGTSKPAANFGINVMTTLVTRMAGSIAGNLIGCATSGTATVANAWGTLRIGLNQFYRGTSAIGLAQFKYSTT